MLNSELVKSDIITDGSALVKNVLHFSPDATEYRVDVFMDKLNHQGRTRLSDVDFGGNLYDTIQYALSNSTAKSYELTKTEFVRKGEFVVVYTVVLK